MTTKKQRGWKAVALLWAGILLLIPAIRAASLLWGAVAFHSVYSDGERVGQVVKLSYRGMIWKSWEAGMGLTQTGAYVGYWEFSVDAKSPRKDALVEELESAVASGALVKVHYVQHLGADYRRGKTSYLVDRVEIIAKPVRK